MTDTNPTGSENQQPQGTIAEAANSFLGLLGGDEAPEQEVGQAEEPQAPEEELQGDEEAPVDEQDAQDAEDDTQDSEPQRYRIKVGGEEQELTLDELTSLAQQGADYTKKTQQVAEQRKAVEAERAAIEEAKQYRNAYAERLQAVEQVLQAQLQGEDLTSLKESDPIGYAIKFAEQQQQKEQLAAIRAERENIAYQQQVEQQQQLQAYLATQAQELARALPEYSDPVKGETLRSELKSFAKNIGFTDAELAQVRDSRQVIALYKAMQYDKLQQAKPQVTKRVSEAPKSVRAGNNTESVNTDTVKRQNQRLKQTGKVADAAALFENFI